MKPHLVHVVRSSFLLLTLLMWHGETIVLFTRNLATALPTMLVFAVQAWWCIAIFSDLVRTERVSMAVCRVYVLVATTILTLLTILWSMLSASFPGPRACTMRGFLCDGCLAEYFRCGDDYSWLLCIYTLIWILLAAVSRSASDGRNGNDLLAKVEPGMTLIALATCIGSLAYFQLHSVSVHNMMNAVGMYVAVGGWSAFNPFDSSGRAQNLPRTLVIAAVPLLSMILLFPAK